MMLLAIDRRRPLTEAELWQDGPSVRVSDLAAITGLSQETIRLDMRTGFLQGTLRRGRLYLVQRVEARRYIVSLGHASRAPIAPEG